MVTVARPLRESEALRRACFGGKVQGGWPHHRGSGAPPSPLSTSPPAVSQAVQSSST
jgi:hypothetical protein